MIRYRHNPDLARLQRQMGEIAEDIAEIRKWQRTHIRQHAAELEEHKRDRRYRLTTTIAALVAICTVMGLLLDILGRVH